jgi:hypothetical protein
MYNKFAKNLLFLIIYVITLSSCVTKPANTPENNTVRSSILAQECESPCWLGIQIGVTKADDAKRILQKRYGVKNTTVNNYNLTWSEEGKNVDGLEQGNVLFTDNLVSEIFLTFDNRSDFKVKDLVDILGSPTWVEVSWGGPIQPNLSCLSISLHFPDKGVLAILDTKKQFKGVSGNQLVSVLRFLAKPNADKWQVYDALLMEWHGYRDYCGDAIKTIPQP